MIYRIVIAIRKEVYTADGMGVEIFKAVCGNEASNERIVKTRFEIVKPHLIAVIIATVTVRVEIAEMCFVGNLYTVGREHLMIAPRIYFSTVVFFMSSEE